MSAPAEDAGVESLHSFLALMDFTYTQFLAGSIFSVASASESIQTPPSAWVPWKTSTQKSEA